MSTMEPEDIEGGRRIEGNSIWFECQYYSQFLEKRKSRELSSSLLHTNRLSSVKRTATPASTLPTVNDINILSLEHYTLISESCDYWRIEKK